MSSPIQLLFCVVIITLGVTCKKQGTNNPPITPVDTSLVNLKHLDYLYTPVTFPTGEKAAGIYIYSAAPDYRLVADADEGFTCVDDVARAAQVYLRSNRFSGDTSMQSKLFNLLHFILGMQADNGYFYNFLLPGDLINKYHPNSTATANWWSWRALQTLTEATAIVKGKNPPLSAKMELSINKLIARIKSDLVNLPLTTKIVQGITVPQWLPAGSGADQAAILILALIPYCKATNDTELVDYVKKLADGITGMQQGDINNYPFYSILSWENQWHAYGSDQANALLQAGTFLNDPSVSKKGLLEIDHFYSWLVSNGFRSSYQLAKNGNLYQVFDEKKFVQIAYGFRPMVSAAAEAFKLTGQGKYADIAGNFAAWFLGANEAGINMYDVKTGRCFDGISSPSDVNKNAGAESTIEALLTMQIVEGYPEIKVALNKYKK